jgi:hypothetical protein
VVTVIRRFLQCRIDHSSPDTPRFLFVPGDTLQTRSFMCLLDNSDEVHITVSIQVLLQLVFCIRGFLFVSMCIVVYWCVLLCIVV